MRGSHRPMLRMLVATLAIAGWLAGGGCGPSGGGGGSSTTPPPGGPPTPVENGKVVRLVPGEGCDPEHCELKKSGDLDHVRWHNPGNTDRTITFLVAWPFMEPHTDIVLSGGAKSQWFTLRTDTANAEYPYKVTPPLRDPGQPPDGPVISAGD